MADRAPLNWLITGASRGLGRCLTENALAAGDRVVATSRTVAALEPFVVSSPDRLVCLEVDLADPVAAQQAVDDAIQAVGHIDVVVNNAGYALAGAVEEVSPDQARAQMDVNFFGALWVTRAVVAHMRDRRCGHIVQVSSIGGVIAAPNLGLYHASKWALEGLSEALAAEVAPFGINVTLVEPGGMRTAWGRASAVRATPMAVYDGVLGRMRAGMSEDQRPREAGDPALVAAAIVDLVGMDDPPLRLVLGGAALDLATAAYQQRLAAVGAVEQLSRGVDRD